MFLLDSFFLYLSTCIILLKRVCVFCAPTRAHLLVVVGSGHFRRQHAFFELCVRVEHRREVAHLFTVSIYGLGSRFNDV